MTSKGTEPLRQILAKLKEIRKAINKLARHHNPTTLTPSFSAFSEPTDTVKLFDPEDARATEKNHSN